MTRTAYIGGTYDPPHIGHIRLIERVVGLGYIPIIAINSDDFILSYKNRKSYMPEGDRLQYFKNLGVDSHIVDKDEQRSFIENINPDVIVVGLDWMCSGILPQLGIDEKFLDAHNIAMLFLTRTDNISSTMLRDGGKYGITE